MSTEIARAILSSFKFLLERYWKSIINCMDRPMSRVGKEAFLKFVSQSISNYVMSLFQVPVRIFDKMKTIIANHWWGFKDGQSKMHWHSWEWIIVPKSLGGMDFRDFVFF
jgi:hypothetical protein